MKSHNTGFWCAVTSINSLLRFTISSVAGLCFISTQSGRLFEWHPEFKMAPIEDLLHLIAKLMAWQNRFADALGENWLKARKSEKKKELIPGGNTVTLHTEIQTVPYQNETYNSKIWAVRARKGGLHQDAKLHIIGTLMGEEPHKQEPHPREKLFSSVYCFPPRMFDT